VLKKRVPRMYGFDIETCDDNKTFICGSLVGPQYRKTFFEKEAMRRAIATVRRFGGSWIVATNLGFDFFGLYHETDEIQRFRTLFRSADLMFAKTNIKGNEYSIPKKGDLWRDNVTFVDTMNYKKASVESLGKMIGNPKYQKPDWLGVRGPEDKKETEYLVEYNLQDSQISRDAMLYMMRGFVALGATPKLTVASTSLSLFRCRYQKTNYFRHPIDVLREQRAALKGGMTIALRRGHIEQMNYYDINSSYPNVMCESFPDPNSLRCTRSGDRLFIEHYEGLTDATVTAPPMWNPYLCIHHSGKLLFPVGTFRGWHTNDELRMAAELGYSINKIHKTYYYTRTCEPFADMMRDLFDLKARYKKENNPLLDVVKLLLNCPWGKFAQRFDAMDNWLPVDVAEYDDIASSDDVERIGPFIRAVRDIEPPAYSIPIWACHVTAKARRDLWRGMAACGHDVVYADTDSIITPRTMRTGEGLGEYKHVGFIDEGLIVRPKFYALKGAIDGAPEYVKLKGVGRKLQYSDMINLAAMPSPSWDGTRFMKPKEALRAHRHPGEIVSAHKDFSLADTKRDWPAAFDPADLQSSMPPLMRGLLRMSYRDMRQSEKNIYRASEI